MGPGGGRKKEGREERRRWSGAGKAWCGLNWTWTWTWIIGEDVWKGGVAPDDEVVDMVACALEYHEDSIIRDMLDYIC